MSDVAVVRLAGGLACGGCDAPDDVVELSRHDGRQVVLHLGALTAADRHGTACLLRQLRTDAGDAVPMAAVGALPEIRRNVRVAFIALDSGTVS